MFLAILLCFAAVYPIFTHDINGSGSGSLTEDGCFEKYPSNTIKCVSHYERHSDITDEECRKLCVEQSPTCQAAVYCQAEQTCDLYDVLPTEPTAPATTPSSNGNGGNGYNFRFWANKRFRRYAGQQGGFQNNYQQQQQNNYGQQQQGNYQQSNNYGQQQQNGYQPQPVPPRPNQYGDRTGIFGTGNGSPVTRPSTTSCSSSSGALITPDPACTAYRQTGACAGSGIVTSTDGSGTTTTGAGSSSTNLVTTTTTTGTQSTTTESTTSTTESTSTTASLPDEAVCDDDEVTRFVEVPFTELDSQESAFDAASESECYGACEDNQLPDGTQVPCRSVNYFDDGACTLTLDTAEDGGTLSENDISTYYEKVCLPADVYEDCPFLRLPDKLLTGFARQVLTVDSLAECEAACVNSQAEFGFDCLSGNYVGDDDEFNCVLTDEDTNSVPDLLTDDFEGGLTYFEPRCNARRFNRRRLSDIGDTEEPMFPKGRDWGPWTYCDPRTSKKMRFRRCKSAMPSDCMMQARKCKISFKLNQSRKNQDPKRCNVRKTCCPIIKSNGRKNCKEGRIFTSQGRQSCKPKKC